MQRIDLLEIVAVIVIAVLLGLFALGVNPGSRISVLLSSSPQPSVASIQHEIFVGQPGNIVLILCEENHASLEIQRNCQLAIETLTSAGIRPVLLLAEGTSPSQIPLPQIFGAGPSSFRLAVAEAWFKLGWLSGIEMAALKDPSLPLFGVEEPNSTERRAHLNALNREYWAWRDFCNELNSLLQKLSDRISLDCTNRGAKWLRFPPGAGQQFLQIAMALQSAQQAEAALEQPVEGALPLATAVGTIQQEISQGKSIREAIAALQRDFPGARTTFSTRLAEWAASLDSLYDAIIETARQVRLDVSRAEGLQQTYQQRRDEADAARDARHGPMIANAQQALTSVDFEVGIIATGARHTAQLKQLLRNQGISYLVITPKPDGLRLFTTPQRERTWFSRNSMGKKPPTPLESWLGGSVKPELTVADPDKQKALATDIALVTAIYRALRGESPGVPAGLLIKNFQARSIPEGIEITVEGINGRQLILQFPSGFELTDVAAQQLVWHLMEALEARSFLMRRDDSFFSPAAHLYLEPTERGFQGGAFISYKPEENTLTTRVVAFESSVSIEQMVDSYKEVTEEDLQYLALNVEKVRKREPSDLFAPMTILDQLVGALNPILSNLGLPETQIVPIALRLAPLRDQHTSRLREVDFTLLASLTRLAGVQGYERRLMFVKSDLEADSDWIQIGGWERLLTTTLANIHHWAATSRHIAVLTVPTTAADWENNPYADYLKKERGRTWEWYESHVLPHLTQAIAAIGPENVVEPRNLDEFFEMLQRELQGAPDATITLTLVAHRQEGQEPVIHFKEGRNVPLKDVLEELRRLQNVGKIPGSAKLEFNVLVCSIGREGAEGFLKRLGARLVLASPHEIDLATNSVLLAGLARKMKEGRPLYEAHFESQEEILRKILEKSVEELDAEGIRSLKMPEPTARRIDSQKQLKVKAT